jgi:hypothetical protein
MRRNRFLGIATSAIWQMIAQRPWAITFAPIFTTFSRRLVSDRRSASPGSARVRRKFAAL